MAGGAAVLAGAAIGTYLLATTFEDEAATVYAGSRMIRGAFVTVMLVTTAFVFITSGSPTLMLMALILVVFTTLYLIFDYYSPFNRAERP
jgi:Ca2+/Na+ antiporter